MLLTNKYYDHKNFHIVCYLCVVHHNGIRITINDRPVNRRVYKCLKTFNHNVTPVYCKGD